MVISHEWIAVFISLIAFFSSLLFFFYRKIDSNTAKTLSCLNDLFSEYKAAMAKVNKALMVSKDLRKYLLKECRKNERDATRFFYFNKVYYSKKYKVFRDVHYFFELLGTLIRQKEFNKMDVWSCFSFPLEFFMETKDIRHIIKYEKCLPAYAKNFIWMFLFYNKNRDKAKRQKNPKVGAHWVINGINRDFTKDEIEELTCGYKF